MPVKGVKSQYLGRFEARSVHSGYFSVDKKGNAVEPKLAVASGANSGSESSR